ncbi:hypothetical protein QBC34DRAFT_476042 [Podospora aff. communis PSN243]|uniref:Uncharacterized protein n=1 Tax=Podospora aff. communis PSN243 TaxID=3040156 RepID=A0AAV9G785_9PEZI|nr:hypothetical protein QBC34DRAFT_476042 [Podospora aff. communis PSN243]
MFVSASGEGAALLPWHIEKKDDGRAEQTMTDVYLSRLPLGPIIFVIVDLRCTPVTLSRFGGQATMAKIRSGLAALLALPAAVQGRGGPDLASADVKTGFQVVFEYVTATDCGPRACGIEPFKAPDVTTYKTVLPEICETGWRDVTYTITETLTRGVSKPTGGPKGPGGGKGGQSGGAPPGFTVTTTQCRRGCAAGPTIVTVTVPSLDNRLLAGRPHPDRVPSSSDLHSDFPSHDYMHI